MKLKIGVAAILLSLAALIAVAVAQSGVGKVIDRYKGVKIYNNGILYARSYGKNYGKDGYYYGQKWQCVEFVKRFYAKAKSHKMPDVWGHARDYFNVKLADGQFNKKRGLLQYKNGSKAKPKRDDIVVFNDTRYGHIAIVSKVGKDYVEVVQQNIYRLPRERYSLVKRKDKYFIIAPKAPAGWLRKPVRKKRTIAVSQSTRKPASRKSSKAESNKANKVAESATDKPASAGDGKNPTQAATTGSAATTPAKTP